MPHRVPLPRMASLPKKKIFAKDSNFTHAGNFAEESNLTVDGSFAKESDFTWAGKGIITEEGTFSKEGNFAEEGNSNSCFARKASSPQKVNLT